jgi:hypothetical protein
MDEGGRGRKLDKDRCGRHPRIARYRTMTFFGPGSNETVTSQHHMPHDPISRGAEGPVVQASPAEALAIASVLRRTPLAEVIEIAHGRHPDQEAADTTEKVEHERR